MKWFGELVDLEVEQSDGKVWGTFRGKTCLNQAVLQGVPFMGVQVLRSKRLVLLREKGSGEPQK